MSEAVTELKSSDGAVLAYQCSVCQKSHPSRELAEACVSDHARTLCD